ncbi:uncharacterized protein NEMAJ01_2340 [Nematocida major]|uniref:uncharacterized protein n=1 Tax=Nematocida major TaxID=1912982 RepID=UPI002008600E|nr:uncharacterized protein NEMAJ01_2340 [Nematocida major]KAH9387444.1 hypothetical protein NEMAJ01_2340 [Nematocida major]
MLDAKNRQDAVSQNLEEKSVSGLDAALKEPGEGLIEAEGHTEQAEAEQRQSIVQARERQACLPAAKLETEGAEGVAHARASGKGAALEEPAGSFCAVQAIEQVEAAIKELAGSLGAEKRQEMEALQGCFAKLKDERAQNAAKMEKNRKRVYRFAAIVREQEELLGETDDYIEQIKAGEKRISRLERALKEKEESFTEAEEYMKQLEANSAQSTEQLDSAERKHVRLVCDVQGHIESLRAAVGDQERALAELQEVEARLELEKTQAVAEEESKEEASVATESEGLCKKKLCRETLV